MSRGLGAGKIAALYWEVMVLAASDEWALIATKWICVNGYLELQDRADYDSEQLLAARIILRRLSLLGVRGRSARLRTQQQPPGASCALVGGCTSLSSHGTAGVLVTCCSMEGR